MRLNRYLAEGGLCSRRKADEWIREGKVKLNGEIVLELGVQVDPGKDRVQVNGKAILPPVRRVVLLLNKPKGVICTVSDTHGRRTVMDLVELDLRVVPVGRLDAESTGALLLTNDGDLMHALLHPSSHVPKEYIVLTDRELTPEEVGKLASGVRLDDGRTKPCEIERIGRPGGRPRYRMVLTEGRNRQIRRMMDFVGAHVERLHRRSLAGLSVEELEPGQWRVLLGKEVDRLRKAVQKAAQAPQALDPVTERPSAADLAVRQVRARPDKARPDRARASRPHSGDSKPARPSRASQEASAPGGRPTDGKARPQATPGGRSATPSWSEKPGKARSAPSRPADSSALKSAAAGRPASGQEPAPGKAAGSRNAEAARTRLARGSAAPGSPPKKGNSAKRAPRAGEDAWEADRREARPRHETRPAGMPGSTAKPRREKGEVKFSQRPRPRDEASGREARAARAAQPTEGGRPLPKGRALDERGKQKGAGAGKSKRDTPKGGEAAGRPAPKGRASKSGAGPGGAPKSGAARKASGKGGRPGEGGKPTRGGHSR